MKKYTIELNNNLSSFYEEIAKINNKSTEQILQDTLYKVIEIIDKKFTKENN